MLSKREILIFCLLVICVVVILSILLFWDHRMSEFFRLLQSLFRQKGLSNLSVGQPYEDLFKLVICNRFSGSQPWTRGEPEPSGARFAGMDIQA